MAINKREIIKALHRGTRTASEDYRTWSGMTLEQAPECLIVVEIARNLNECLGQRESLRLEAVYQDLLAGANVTKRGARFKSIGGAQRADIALLNGVKPTCIIEVKKKKKGIVDDLERLRDVVYTCRNHPGVVKHGFLAIWLSSDDTEYEIDSIIDTIVSFFENDKSNRAQAKRPSAKTWDNQASIVVEVTAAKNG